MSSPMCSYFMLILLHSKMFVFCVFFYSCITLMRDHFSLHANSNSRFIGMSKGNFQRGANLRTHVIAQFLIVPLGIKIHSREKKRQNKKKIDPVQGRLRS